MTFYFLSEHYKPRLGGVTTYVREICETMYALGHSVNLIVPSDGNKGEIKEMTENGVKVHYLGTGNDVSGNISKETRLYFCAQTQIILNQNIKKNEVLHILFGLYLMAKLDIKRLKNQGVKVAVTIHNIPPQECGKSWNRDSRILYLKDIVRKLGVKYVNKKRIIKNTFDIYFVPSLYVKNLLKKYLPKANIKVVGHGLNQKNLKYYSQKPRIKTEIVQFLTVGGIVPHKRQGLIPSIASKLVKDNMKFEWHIIGPVRNRRYLEYLKQKIFQFKLEAMVKFHENVSFEDLMHYYIHSDCYVQPSLEEGFCITTLDAAAFGIPIIGCPTGAIPEIINDSNGILCTFDEEDIYNAIVQLKDKSSIRRSYDLNALKKIQSIYNWKIACSEMLNDFR